MNAIAKALVEQVATWDKHEETWEVNIPLPKQIRAEYDDFEVAFDGLREFFDWAEQVGVDHHYAAYNDSDGSKVLTVVF